MWIRKGKNRAQIEGSVRLIRMIAKTKLMSHDAEHARVV